MTTTRKPISRNRRIRITPEALEAYKRARKLYDASKVDEWGQLSDQCRTACSELHALLGRTACDLDIMDTIGFDELPTELPYRPWNDDDWLDSFAIRLELE